MPHPHGFSYEQHADGTVVITHRGRAATLRGGRAEKFLAEVDPGAPSWSWPAGPARTGSATSARPGTTPATAADPNGRRAKVRER